MSRGDLSSGPKRYQQDIIRPIFLRNWLRIRINSDCDGCRYQIDVYAWDYMGLVSGCMASVTPLQQRDNERNGVSNHRRLDCYLNRLFRRRPTKTSMFCVTGRCQGNSPVTGEFPAHRTSNAENVSIWWRHHAFEDRAPWPLDEI